ncbi:hypothetical protein BBO99_00004205 [Phytophthora kernoviae]|uniref:Rab-GAP TBC domain-containing protein n=1 Tax=Phytophthora kernoviae TaxID=325452 RepID=A0A3R7K1D2_9STRA|nr:hypothetical protein BBI17_004051 [Phytophthora kernoviae]RLN80856.1 hypothetical protein BBO99_00004205 [Phytophthora kernoviae]
MTLSWSSTVAPAGFQWKSSKTAMQIEAVDEASSPKRLELSCHCERQVLECYVTLGEPTEADLDTVEDLYLYRLRKWSERFVARDWTQERVCQKWKENQQRFLLQEAVDGTEDTKKMAEKSTGSTVKRAFSNFATAAELLLHSRQFDGLLKAGVSPQLRGQVWWMCSGAAELKQGAKEKYPTLVRRLHTLSKCAEMDIEKDLPRTFPLALRSSMRHSQEAVEGSDNFGELRRVLQAYSLRNPAVGYCQSMNFLAAVLLQHMGEEEAFWVLAAIVEELTPQYHTRTMTGSRADQRVFSDLVTQKLPTLATHLQALGVDFEPFTLKWFLCLFLNTLPFEPVMRIWDVFFCEGSHVLLRMGLVLLKLNQPRILACDDALDVYEMFKVSHETLQELTAPYRSGLLNRDECVCDTLIRLAMDKSFLGSIPFDSLHELRQYYRYEIEAELEEVEARRLVRRRSEKAHAGVAASEGGMALVNGGKNVDLEQGENEGLTTCSSREDTEDSTLLMEYDFVDDYVSGSGSEASPARHIRFIDLYDSDDSATDYFVDVMYDFSLQHHCR